MCNSKGTIICLQRKLKRGSGEAETSAVNNETWAVKFGPQSFGALVASYIRAWQMAPRHCCKHVRGR